MTLMGGSTSERLTGHSVKLLGGVTDNIKNVVLVVSPVSHTNREISLSLRVGHPLNGNLKQRPVLLAYNIR